MYRTNAEYVAVMSKPVSFGTTSEFKAASEIVKHY